MRPWFLSATVTLILAGPAMAQNAPPANAPPANATSGERTQQNSADEAVPKGNLEAAQKPDDPAARQRSLQKLEDAAEKAKGRTGAPAGNTGGSTGPATTPR